MGLLGKREWFCVHPLSMASGAAQDKRDWILLRRKQPTDLTSQSVHKALELALKISQLDTLLKRQKKLKK